MTEAQINIMLEQNAKLLEQNQQLISMLQQGSAPVPEPITIRTVTKKDIQLAQVREWYEGLKTSLPPAMANRLQFNLKKNKLWQD